MIATAMPIVVAFEILNGKLDMGGPIKSESGYGAIGGAAPIPARGKTLRSRNSD